MKNIFIWGVVVAAVVIGGYWYVEKSKSIDSAMTQEGSDMGSYAYMCEGGVEFTMSPSSDVSTIKITPGANATFGEATLAATQSTAGARFEGGGIVFVGAGEEVQLTTDGRTMVCNPKPNPDMAPWNWGDAGEGGGSVKQDTSLIVSESIVGKWQSSEDTKFVREFKADGAVVDWYDGKTVSTGLWVAYTKANAPKMVAFPIDVDAVYLQLTMKGTQADTLDFKITKLTPESLELIYMTRGGALTFKHIQ